jgi:transposase
MGQALAYLANHWQGLCLYLDDGRVEMGIAPAKAALR